MSVTRRRYARVSLVVSSLLALSSVVPAKADSNFFCTGQVAVLGISPNSGLVSMSNGYGVHYLCSVITTMNGIDPTTCKGYYALFLSAKLSGRTITEGYAPTPTATSCSDLGSWVTPNPFPYWIAID